MGGYRLIAWDFDGPDVEDDEMREIVRVKREAVFHFWQHLPGVIRRRHVKQDKSISSSDDTEKTYDVGHYDEECAVSTRVNSTAVSVVGDGDIHEDGQTVVPDEGARSPRISHAVALDVLRSHVTSPAPTVRHAETATHVDNHNPDGSPTKNVRFDEKTTSSLLNSMPRRRRIMHHLRDFIISLASPPSMSIIISFPIALITPLKALFIAVPNSPIPNAPDGQPPLAFIMDTATFVGAASVPMGLICLGSALARLKLPMNRASWHIMPVGAISALAVARIVISPILGILICEGLTSAGVIDKEDKVLRFVCMYVSSPIKYMCAR